MTNVVLDTVIFVRALINPASKCGQLLFDHGDAYTIVVSQPLVVECLEVFRRPRLADKYRIVPGRDLPVLLDKIRSAEMVEVNDIPSIFRDPSDDMLYATAKAGNASFIVTEDKDMLDHGDLEGITIVTAETFVQRVIKAGGCL